MGSQSGEDVAWCGKAVAARWQQQQQAEQAVPYSCAADKNQEGQLGSKQSITSGYKTSGGWGSGRKCWSLRRVSLKGPQGPEHKQTHLLWESVPGQQLEGCQSLMERGGSDWKWGKSQTSCIVPSLTTHPHTPPQSNEVVCTTLANT